MLKWRPIIVQGRICVDMLESNIVNGVAGLEALKHGSFNSFSNIDTTVKEAR